MEVYLNRVDGIDDAIISLYLSKRSLTPELEAHIREEVRKATIPGGPTQGALDRSLTSDAFRRDYLDKLFRWGRKHMTLLRFIDLSFTDYGLHRGAQDDFDSHAMRLQNRIVRSSTRLADYQEGELSDYYRDKIIPLEQLLTFWA